MKTLVEDKFFILPCVVIAMFLYFFNLENYYLGLDLADYPLHALNILKHGVPYFFDSSPPTFDPRLAVNGVWAYHPWLGMYLIAASFLLFGDTTFGAVFPTALSGILALPILYRLAKEVSGNVLAARISVILYLTSTQCILYMRTSRYLGLTFLLCIATLFFFMGLLKNRNEPIILFCMSSILLFYAMYSQFFGLFFGLFLFCTFHVRDSFLIKRLLKSAGLIAVFTLPWFLYYFIPIQKKVSDLLSLHYNENYQKNLGTIFEFTVGFLTQLNLNTFPFVFLIILIVGSKCGWIKYQLNPKKILLLWVTGGILLTGSLHTIPLLNYILGAIPLTFIFLGEILAILMQKNLKIGMTLLVITIMTNWLHIAPLWTLDKILPSLKSHTKTGNELIKKKYPLVARWRHSISGNIDVSYYFFYFLKELFLDFKRPLKTIVKFLLVNAKPNDRFVTSHEGDSILFYTKLKWSNKFPFESPPEWIIPRGPRNKFSEMTYFANSQQKAKSTKYVWNYIQEHPYKKIELDIWDNGYENSYNIANHIFENILGRHKVTLYHYEGTQATSEKSFLENKSN